MKTFSKNIFPRILSENRNVKSVCETYGIVLHKAELTEKCG